VHLGELDQAFDAEVDECQDAVFSDALDPDDAILDFHFAGDVAGASLCLRRAVRQRAIVVT